MDAAEMRERAKGIAGRIQDFGKRATANPVSAVLAALAAGFIAGLVFRFFERSHRQRGEK